MTGLRLDELNDDVLYTIYQWVLAVVDVFNDEVRSFHYPQEGFAKRSSFASVNRRVRALTLPLLFSRFTIAKVDQVYRVVPFFGINPQLLTFVRFVSFLDLAMKPTI